MPELTRRRLLSTAGAATAAAFAAEFLPASVRKALAAGPPRGSGRLSDIKHVVILMQENRSFDHYFGTLPGVRGFSDPNALTLSTGNNVFYQPDPANPDGYLLPWRLNTLTTSAESIPSSSHAWKYQHTMWDNGAMDNFVPSQLAAKGAEGPITSNVDPVPYGWQTYPEALTNAGVSWQVYQEVDNYETNLLEMFKTFQGAPVSSTLFQSGLRTFSPGQFEWDAMHDRLPAVSWLVPTSYQSEHPDYTPAAGADFVASKIDAIAANPDVWAKTVFILNYDENDGLFDHVPPPTAPA